MKFSAVFFAGLAAVTQVQATPQPQLGDFLDDVGDFVSNAGDWASDVRTAFDGIETEIQDIIDDPEGQWSDIRASLTEQFDNVLASLSAAAATNSDAQEAEEAIAQYSSQIDRILAEASNAVEDNSDNEDDGDAASLTTAGVALAGILGGAALFFNL